MPHFITTHSINNPNYIKMQQNKNQQLDAKFRKFIKVLIMAQIRNFGFEQPVQELDIQHPARPRGGAGQLGGQPEGTEPTVRHPHHSGADGKGLGGDVPVGHDHQQLADGAVPAVQVPPPEGAGKAGHPMLRRMGGDIRQEDDGLRVQRDEQHRAEGALPLLHQGAGAGGVL